MNVQVKYVSDGDFFLLTTQSAVSDTQFVEEENYYANKGSTILFGVVLARRLLYRQIALKGYVTDFVTIAWSIMFPYSLWN